MRTLDFTKGNPENEGTSDPSFPSTEPLINTGALTRWKYATPTREVFQQFLEWSRKPLKRLIRPGTSLRRAEAPVLMRSCWKASGVWGVTAALLQAGAVSTLADVHYVDLNCTNATPPYTNWATAATNIQDAVDAAVAGDEIVVTNGTYATGVRAAGDSTFNRLLVDKPLNIRSVNGPLFTAIHGDVGYIRCVYLTNVATLSGFTLAYGSANYGGGAFGGTLSNCALSFNTATVGGGGAAYCTLNNCTLSGNSAAPEPCFCSPSAYGGGAYECTLNNCTVAHNQASVYGPKSYGGGVYGGGLNNCIVYYNSAENGSDYYGASLFNCCSTPSSRGGPCCLDGITNAPLLVDDVNGNLRLQSNSPCINAGNNAYAPAGPDLDGNPRIAGGTVDIGAYEFQSPTSVISYAWLQQYGLPTDGSADFTDPDGDGMNNWQEWVSDTNPTNALSGLRLLPPLPAVSGVNVTWQSVNTRSYVLERSSNLAAAPAFTPLVTNISGQAGTTTFLDTNAIGAGPWFYRVSVGR